MLSLIAGLLAMQVPVGQPPRLRTLLPNRATIFVERVPKAPTLSIQLFISAKGTLETPQTNGRRHLLEHLLARGATGDIDRRLETEGGYLNAHTMRDAMQFEVSVPAGKLKLGLEALEETMHLPPITQAQIQHETQIIAQEGALRTAMDRLASAAWAESYGDQGLDAFGTLDVMRRTPPTELSELHRKMFVGSNLVISIAGDVDLDTATRQVEDMLRVIPMGDLTGDKPRPPASFSAVSLPEGGDARGAPAPGMLSPKLAWTLAAGLAVAAGVEHGFVTYTPTVRDGLVIVGETSGNELGKQFESADANELMALGRRLAAAWVGRHLDDPEDIASFRGMMLVQDAGLRPETLLENLASMTVAEFQEGLDAFRKAKTSPAGVGSGVGTPPRTAPVEGAGDFSTGRSEPGPFLQASSTGKATFIELPDPGFLQVQAVAVVKLPPLDAHERSMLGQLISGIPFGTADYSRRDILEMTGGNLIRCQLMSDCLTIEVPAWPENLAGAIDVLAEILQTPHPSAPGSASDFAQEQVSDPWESILHGPFARPDGLRLLPGELDSFFHEIFRPDRVTVAISGPFSPGDAQSRWERKIQAWKPPKYPHAWPPAEPLPSGNPEVDGVELDGPEIPANAQDLPASLLAMFALGSGKGSSLFEVAREQDGLSYRQESILWPSQSGWTPRLLLASAGLKDGQATGEELRKQLLAAVAGWTDADRLRAAGLAEGALLRGVPLSPFYFQPDGPVDGSIGNEAFLEAYWMAKTGEPWNPMALSIRMKDVSLESLKAEATRLLSASQIRVQNVKQG